MLPNVFHVIENKSAISVMIRTKFHCIVNSKHIYRHKPMSGAFQLSAHPRIILCLNTHTFTEMPVVWHELAELGMTVRPDGYHF